jgi:hypothetical protein
MLCGKPWSAGMPGVDDAAVERLAKELCEQDGNVWDALDFGEPKRWAKIGGTPTIGEERRRDYLARAKEQLTRKSDS